MRDYARIAAKIRETPWLITEEGIKTVLEIFETRKNMINMSDEELAEFMNSRQTHTRSDGEYGNGYVSGAEVQNGVGIIPIYGPIFGKANLMTQLSGATSLEAVKSDLTAMLADNNVKSIIMDIDSPGGTSEMVQSTGDIIYAARDIKPVAAVANSGAGSAAYWIGSQADKLYATPDGMVGSIGAFTVHEDHSVADAKDGVKYTFISAGKYKTEGNPHEPLSKEGEDYRQGLINELYDKFVGSVARGRGTTSDNVIAKFGEGRMLSADKALEVGMIDSIQEFDAVVESHTATGTQISVPISVTSQSGTKVKLKGMLNGNGLVSLTLTESQIGAFVSNTDYEHSEPGTGSPPARREPESDDIAFGSRRNLPEGFPHEETAPGAPSPNASANGGNMNEELYQLFGVEYKADGSNEEALLTAIKNMHTQASALSGDVSLAGQEAKFKAEYPDIWKTMQEDKAKRIDAEATAFVAGHKLFGRMEGEQVVSSGFALSALCQDNLKELHKKFAMGTANIADFESFMDSVFKGGTVQLGEVGSSLEGELPETEIVPNTATAEGIRNARMEFGKKVQQIKTEDKLSYADAVSEAAKRYPQLAAAYRENAVVVS